MDTIYEGLDTIQGGVTETIQGRTDTIQGEATHAIEYWTLYKGRVRK